MVAHGFAQLFHRFIGLIRHRVVDEHHAAVGRDVLQEGDHLFPLLLVQLENIEIRHHNEGPLRHHGHSLRHLAEALDRQVFPLHPVIVELLEPGGDQLLPQLSQVVLPQIALLAVKDIGAAGGTGGQVVF